MSTEAHELYIKRNPGDLVTADDWNDVQRKIKDDINQQVTTAIGNIKQVPEAKNALTLQGQSADELSAAILEQARQELPKRTGYQRIFKRLRRGDENIVEHKLGGCPLVDVYQLDTIAVVSSEDDQKEAGIVYFFLYHSSERRIKPPAQQGQPSGPGIEIEPTGGVPFRIAFSDMLAYYNVKYTDSSTLEDLETEFWEAFLAKPNDDFDDDEYAHSPWFDRCCGERRTVADLKSRGDWDELWFKVVPRKTINRSGINVGEPFNIEVAHYDFNKLGIKFESGESFEVREQVPAKAAELKPAESADVQSLTPANVSVVAPPSGQPFEDLAVMVLLKV
jgi:hypothetical protein